MKKRLTYCEVMKAEAEMVKASKENKRKVAAMKRRQIPEIPRERDAADRPVANILLAD